AGPPAVRQGAGREEGATAEIQELGGCDGGQGPGGGIRGDGLLQGRGRKTNPSETISKDEQRLLLGLARSSMLSTLPKGRKLPAVESLSTRLREKRGVFVTLWLDGLRGCIGFPYPVEPLAEAVQEASVSAALHDPRFPPVRPEEMAQISIEISVLTVPKE